MEKKDEISETPRAPTDEIPNPLERCLEGLSPYQYYVIIVVGISKGILFWHIINMLFLYAEVEYTCNGIPGGCCSDPVWDTSVFTKTFSTKFNVVCSPGTVTFTQMLAYVGVFFGSFSWGLLSDRYGRLFCFGLVFAVVASAGMLIAFMPNILMFTAMRFIEGFGCGGAIVVSYVLVIEYCCAHHREMLSSLYSIPLCISQMSVPGISYIFRDMDHFQIAISIPLLSFVVLRFFMKESPKWLMDNNKLDKLDDALKKICPKCDHIMEDIKTYLEYKRLGINVSHDQPKDQVWHIFRHKYITINFFCMVVNYVSCGMGYYGVTYLIGHLGSSANTHLNVFMSGVTMLPGVILCILLLKVLSRRTLLIICNFIAGSCLVTAIVVKNLWVKVICACASNCAFFVNFIIIFLYTVELFPTSVRSSVFGILNVMSRIGQILVPPITNILSQLSAGSVFAAVAFLAGLMCLPLPDTKGMELPSTLEDSNKIIAKTHAKRVSRFPRLSPGQSKS